MAISVPAGNSGLEAIAARVASMSVEAARSKSRRSKRKPSSKKKTTTRKKTTKKSKKPVRRTTRRVPSVSEDVLADTPEFACRVELDITAAFEGKTNKAKLIRKLKAELVNSVETSIGLVARELNLASNGVKVRPLRLECDVNEVG